MTANRDADRIVRAWLDLMPEEAPDRTIAAVIEALDVTPQVRRPLGGRWRPTLMNRLLVAAVAAALVVAVGGVVLLKPSGQSGVGGSPSANPTSPAGSASASASGSALADVPSVLRQDWQADVAVDALPALGPHDARIQLSFAYDTREAWIQTGIFTNQNIVLGGTAYGTGPSTVRLVSSDSVGGCRSGDEGVYSWAISGNGLYLALTAQSEACASRMATLQRTWVHSLAARNLGGPGVLSYFQPSIQMTLPAANWGAGGETGAASVTSDTNSTFIAVKNPAGFTQPCVATGRHHVAEPATIAGFTAYLKSLPGFTVTSTSATIGGMPATHLTIPTSSKTVCDDGRLYEFAPNDLTSSGGWFITPGDPDTIWLVQVGKDLYLLQWLKDGATAADEQNILSTISFIDKLPTP
jgi:hypothetical protein